MEHTKRAMSGWKGGRRVLSGASSLALVCGVLSSAPAGAAPAACGQFISSSTTLDADVGPCPGFGLIINGSNVTLDLGGHRVFGTGHGTGIQVVSGTGIRVQNGVVSGFGAGIGFDFGPQQPQARVVTSMRVADNTDFGIEAWGSIGNTFTRNQIANNGGPGIRFRGTFGPGSGPLGNVVEGNSIEKNRGPGVSLGGFTRANVVAGNRVAGNGLQGVVAGGFAGSNQVVNNLVSSNGFGGSEPSAGIDFASAPGAEFSSGNVVRGNLVTANAGNGIHMTRGGNQIVVNRTGGNGSGGPNAFDLLDSSPDQACDQNLWSGNTFGSAFPPCTTAP